MEEKKTKRELINGCGFDVNELDGLLVDEAIDTIQNVRYAIPDHYFDIRLKIDKDYYSNASVLFEGERIETDKEFETRLAARNRARLSAETRKTKKEKADLALLKRLKEKYGDRV